MENNNAGKRLNKYLSDSGYCSRREADRLIQEGRVKIDGRIGSLGDRVQPGMKVTCGAVFCTTNGMSPSLHDSRSSLSPPSVELA